MQEIVLDLQYMRGAIRKDIVRHTKDGLEYYVTGVDVIDNDELLSFIEVGIAMTYRYPKSSDSSNNADPEEALRISRLKCLTEKHIAMLICRLKEINDGSFVVVDELPEDIEVLDVSEEEYRKYISELQEWISSVIKYSSYSMVVEENDERDG